MKTEAIILIIFMSSFSLFAQIDTTEYENEELLIGPWVVEKMPEYVGGYEALKRHIITNSIYTDNALKDSVNGKVFVSFWVEKNGAIVKPRILRGLHHDLDSISLRLIEDMPNWIPATQRGKPIKCRYILPIEFNFNSNVNINYPEPSKYWEKKGRKQFLKKCLIEFGKNQTECDCWYRFIIWNYNNYRLKDIDLSEMFEKQKCN